jgi:hypothetical protein
MRGSLREVGHFVKARFDQRIVGGTALSLSSAFEASFAAEIPGGDASAMKKTAEL